MMNRYSDGTVYDSEKLLKQLDTMIKEEKKAPKDKIQREAMRKTEGL